MKKNSIKKLKPKKMTFSQNVSFLCTLFFISIFPLILGKYKYINIIDTKYICFCFVSILLLILIMFEWVFKKKKKTSLISMIKSISLDKYLIVAFVLWSAISCIFSKYSFNETFFARQRYDGLFVLILYVILYLIFSHFGKTNDITIIAIGIVSIIYGSIAFCQCLGLKIFYPLDANYYIGYFISTTGHHDLFSGIVSMFIPMLFCSFVLVDKKYRFFLLPSIFILFVSFLFTKVDSGKIGLIAAFLMILPFVLDSKKHIAKALQASSILLFGYAIFSIYKGTRLHPCLFDLNGKFYVITIISIVTMIVGLLFERSININKSEMNVNKEKNNRIKVLFILTVLIIVGIIFVYIYKGDNQLINEASSLLHGNITDEMGTYRGYIWKNSFKIIADHPILGSGTGTFASEFVPYNGGYQEFIPYTIVDVAHNDYIQIAACQGVVGLLLYIAFLIVVIVKAIKKAGNNMFVIILLSGVIGYLAYITFVFSTPIITPIFWTLLGLLRYETEQNNYLC